MTEIIYAPKPPGNYIQDYNDQFKNIYRKHLDTMNHDALAELAAFGHVAAQASCWILTDPVRDFIMNTTLPPDALESWQLPYPRMTIEWRGTWDIEAVKQNQRTNNQMYIPALERIIMLTNAERVVSHDLHFNPETGLFVEKPVPEDEACEHDFAGFYLSSFFRQPPVATENRSPLAWAVNPVALLVPYSALNHLDTWFGKHKNGDLRMLTKPLDPVDQQIADDRPTPVCALRCAKHAWAGMIDSGQAHEGIRDLIEEVHIAFGLLAMLRCENVPTRTIKASPLKQRRRKQQKRSRIPDYRTLHLSDHTLRGYHGGKGTPGEKSPHWRRGHIRNQHTALGPVRKWIAPQIIRADKLTDGDLPKPKTVIT